MTSNHSDQRGFTLIEILVVIVILSILGGLAAQTLLSRPDAGALRGRQLPRNQAGPQIILRDCTVQRQPSDGNCL